MLILDPLGPAWSCKKHSQVQLGACIAHFDNTWQRASTTWWAGMGCATLQSPWSFWFAVILVVLCCENIAYRAARIHVRVYHLFLPTHSN